MYFQQADLFWGMSRNFVEKILKSAEKESHSKGHFLFHEGDPAGYFYILIKGRVKLAIGEIGQVVHTVDHAGEAFGWSSLVGREVYSASAECVLASKCFRIDREAFNRVLEKKTADGVIFFRRLAGILGERLINIYDTLLLG